MDETTLHLPDPWRDQVVLRRGGRVTVEVALDPTAEQFEDELAESQAASMEAILGHRKSDPELVAAARAYLRGEPEPLGASRARCGTRVSPSLD